jgi:hypothetical protein
MWGRGGKRVSCKFVSQREKKRGGTEKRPYLGRNEGDIQNLWERSKST